ncbi:uncharacterized protein A4U43_C08F26120 [Asparagus officinalis]|nr:uncharacterized protein A4U43_C08F26120 [Asparagus officinalis]
MTRTHHNNAFYARVGGLSNVELNRLELELLFLLDFDVMVSLRVFESYCLHLEKEMMLSGTNQKIERPILESVDNEFGKSDNGGEYGSSSLPPPHSID